jgi:hypothetical protein
VKVASKRSLAPCNKSRTPCSKSRTPFTLFFQHEYTDKSITERGCDALKGNDHGRFRALHDANAMVPNAMRKLQFYIAKIAYEIGSYNDGGGDLWEERERSECISKWHTVTVTPLGDNEYSYCSSSTIFSQLNPDKLSMRELWGDSGSNTYEGYLGNESAIKSTKHCRYAPIAWPCANDLELCFEHIGLDSAVVSCQISRQRPMAAEALTSFAHEVRRAEKLL